MTTFPISSSNDLKKYNVNKINQDSGGILSDSRYPYLLYQGLHCGGFDRLLYDQSSIDGLVGCGLNPYGFYGIQYGETGNKPVFLLSGKPFNTPDWGQAYAGEFRVGDNVKEDNGSLVGKNWLWFNPKNGLNISGPILRTNSSDVNIIQYPDFSITTEFVYSMEYNNSGQYFRATGDQHLVVKGYKTIDGASFIRGSILYYASPDFAGTVYIQGVTYDSDHNELSRSQSVINILPNKWKQYNFVVRLTEGEYFELGLAVRDYTSGTIDFKRWSAFKVFQAAIDSSELPETLPGEDKSVVIDKTGIKGYWPADKYNPGIPDFEQETIDGKIKTFEVSAANGSAYFRGSILVNGFIHSGPRYKPIYNGSTLQKTYIAGCGINEYGVYGIKGVESGGEYVQGNSRFLIAAKSIDTSGSSDSSHYWGDEITEGELRVGLGIRYDKFNHRLLNDVGTEESPAYMWFFPGNSSYPAELKIKGNIHATSGIFSGNIILDGGALIAYKTNDSNTYTAMGNTGFSAHSSDKGWTFFVSNGDTWGTREGEFRVGEGIDNINSSTNFMQFRPGYGLKIVANGIDISPVSSSFGGGANTKLKDLSLTGILTLSGTESNGIPSSYIGITGSNGATYISKDGIAIKANNKWQAFLLGKDHSFADGTNAVFYVGEGYSNSSVLGNSYLYFNGTSLQIKINGNEVLNTNSSLKWSKVTDDDGKKPEDNATFGTEWDLAQIPQMPDVLKPSISGGSLRTGLNINNDYIGYSTDGTTGGLRCYIDKNGNFRFGSLAKFVQWDGSSFVVRGSTFTDKCYISDYCYVGDDDSGIEIVNDGTTAPYIQSHNSTDKSGWKISNNGTAYISDIKPYGANTWTSLYVQTDSYDYASLCLAKEDGASNGPKIVLETYDASYGTCEIYIGGGWYSRDIKISNAANGTIYLGNGSSDILYIKSTQIKMNSSTVDDIYLGNSSCSIGFFGNSPITRPEVLIPDNGAWHPGSTNTSEIRDDLDNLHSIVTDLLHALQNDSNGLGLIHYHT